MKWIPIFHQMTEIREKLDSIYKVDNQWKYRPRKAGFKIYSSSFFWHFTNFLEINVETNELVDRFYRRNFKRRRYDR